MKNTRLKAELWDKVHYLMRSYWDGMSHSIIYYNGVPDEEILRKAITHIYSSVPVFHSSFIDDPLRPYWEVKPFDIDKAFSVIRSSELVSEAMAFVSGHIDVSEPAQLKLRLICGENKSALCVLLNHMCMDGGEYKYIIAKLCETYMRLKRGEAAPTIKNGSRSYKEMYSGLSDEQKKKAKLKFKNVSATKNRICLPFTKKSAEDRPLFIERVLGTDDFEKLKSRSRADGVTMNSVLQAAFARAIYIHSNAEKNEELQISCMKDLRAAMKNNALDTGITNHTGFIRCRLSCASDSMTEAVRKVNDDMNMQKNDPYLGMYGIPLLNLAYTIFPKFIAGIAIHIGYKSPRFSLSNMGLIDSGAISLGDCAPYDCFMTGTVKYKPAIQLSTFTMNKKIHMTFAVLGNDRDEELISDFADTIVSELRVYAV